MDEDLRQAAKDLLIRYGGDSFPNLFRSAKGSTVTDDEGREILDFTSGQMCATIGHNHPAIVKAIAESCDTAIHLFSGMIPETVVKLAQKLEAWLPAPLKRSLFVNTGSESNEAALRLAKMATGGYEVVALGGSWHGTTGGSAAATFASDRRGYGPKVPGVHALPEPNAYRCPIEHCRADFTEKRLVSAKSTDAYYLELCDFLQAVEGGEPENSALNGKKNIALGLGIYYAFETGRRLEDVEGGLDIHGIAAVEDEPRGARYGGLTHQPKQLHLRLGAKGTELPTG